MAHSSLRPSSLRKRIIFILVVTLLSLYIGLPTEIPIHFSVGKFSVNTTLKRPGIDLRIGSIAFSRDLNIKKGLDLQGGTQITLEATMDPIPEADRMSALQSATSVISRRVDLYGVSESVVQSSASGGHYRIIVELPGVTDSTEALKLIGQTAKLEFREEGETPTGAEATTSAALAKAISSMKPTDLGGGDLRRADVRFDQKGGEPVVGLTFNDEGRRKFADITKRNVGKRVGIFLDDVPLTIPVVQTPITDGQAIISGGFTTKDAKQLVISLNAGALPVALAVISQTQIGATLGEQSIALSLRAGAIGLGIVAIAMIIWYRKLGLIADLTLVIYTVITLAIYKLVPVTLTLPGIAGFLLSIGMATDANILIFERLREERARGMRLAVAIELGFTRAWDSIKDANVSTLIAAFVLYNPLDWKFLNTSGLVRGFALTLTIGIIISLFTGIVVSRTLIRFFYRKETLK